jgi:hypothetical protein
VETGKKTDATVATTSPGLVMCPCGLHIFGIYHSWLRLCPDLEASLLPQAGHDQASAQMSVPWGADSPAPSSLPFRTVLTHIFHRSLSVLQTHLWVSPLLVHCHSGFCSSQPGCLLQDQGQRGWMLYSRPPPIPGGSTKTSPCRVLSLGQLSWATPSPGLQQDRPRPCGKLNAELLPDSACFSPQ